MAGVLFVLLSVLAPGIPSAKDAGCEQLVAAPRFDSVDVQAQIDLIRKMETERIQAGVRKDTEAIAAATADDYVQIDFDGKVWNKATAMARIRSSEIQLQSNTIDDVDVRIYGNTAVVTARSIPKGTINGKDFSRPMRYSRVYVNRNGRWQVVLFQLTRIAQAE